MSVSTERIAKFVTNEIDRATRTLKVVDYVDVLDSIIEWCEESRTAAKEDMKRNAKRIGGLE